MDDKKDIELTEKDYLLANSIIKIAAIERLLVKANIFTSDDLTNEMSALSKELIDNITKAVNSVKN